MEAMLQKLTASNEELLLRSMHTMEQKFITLTKLLMVDHNTDNMSVGPVKLREASGAAQGKENTPPLHVFHNAEGSAGNTLHRDDDVISLAPTIASRCFGAGMGDLNETSSTITRRSRTPTGDEVNRNVSRSSVHSAHSNAAAAASGNNEQHITILDDDQIYWENQLEDYQQKQEFGPEISSTIAGAAKVFWQKKMSEERLTKTLDVSKVPNNCKFLAVKKANKEIWSCTSPDIRTRDFSLQKMQETHSFMTSTIMQAVNELSALKSKSMQPIMGKLKDALKLAGKTNQQINTHRRDSFKPSIPPELMSLPRRIPNGSLVTT